MRVSARSKRLSIAFLAAVAALVVVGLPWIRQTFGPEESVVEVDFGRAAAIYRRQCSACHGPEGFGDGDAAYLIHPRPRDFSYGKFLLVSTDNRVPTDDDLFNTITNGMPGSAMPPWEQLPEQDRRDLVRYVRALAHRGKVLRLMGLGRDIVAAGYEEGVQTQPMSRVEAEETATYLLTVGRPLELPTSAPASDGLVARGREIYVGTCAKCHGREGRGDGSEVMEDDLGFRAFPRDFTRGVFKGGTELEQLAHRVLGGMPGSAMPSTEFERGEGLWAVVHYVRSLVDPGAQERVQQRRQHLTAASTSQPLEEDPTSSLWNEIEPTYVALVPLWWRDERVEGVEVRAAHDGERVGIHLTWNDTTPNQDQAFANSFTDGAAVQFSSDTDPPFFGMGDAAGTVNIWMWKAVWENQILTRNGPVPAYPRALMDFDIAAKRPGAAVAADTHNSLKERDPTFYSGWGAGNPISNPHRTTPVENLNARGFGTVQAQASAAQIVRGKGEWKEGVWRCVFFRDFSASGAGQIVFRPGQSVRVGFAVWDGESGDRNGQKSVTIWHDLMLEK